MFVRKNHEEKVAATELKNQQIFLFYLIYTGLCIHYRQHLLEEERAFLLALYPDSSFFPAAVKPETIQVPS